jgi:hypothetical protein
VREPSRGVRARRRPPQVSSRTKQQQVLAYKRLPDEIDVMSLATPRQTHHVDLIMDSAIDRTGPSGWPHPWQAAGKPAAAYRLAMRPTERPQPRRAATPWHPWVVGIFFLALYGVGARDYVLSLTLDTEYFDAQGYGPFQVAYFADYPVVPAICWTINILGGLVASLLLLLRSRWAVHATLVCAVAQLCLLVLTFGFRDRWNVFGPRLSLFDIGIWVITLGLWLYSRAMRVQGVLR